MSGCFDYIERSQFTLAYVMKEMQTAFQGLRAALFSPNGYTWDSVMSFILQWYLSWEKTEVRDCILQIESTFFFFFCFLGRRKEGKVPCDFTSRFYVPFSVNTLSILLDGIFKYTMALIFYCFNNLSGFVFNNLSLKMKPNYFSKETYYQYKNKVSICLLIIKNLLWIWTVS